jgi:hypothetical protein
MNEQLQDKLAKMDADALDRAYMETFNTDNGQLVLEDLRNRCFFFTTTLGPDMQFNEGQRAVVMNIETRLRPIKQEPKQEDSNV